MAYYLNYMFQASTIGIDDNPMKEGPSKAACLPLTISIGSIPSRLKLPN